MPKTPASHAFLFDLQQSQFNWMIGVYVNIQKEILADVKAGVVPLDMKSFGDLHSYVDANEYGGFCDNSVYHVMEPDELKGLDAVKAQFPGKDPMDICGLIQEAINLWLSTGGLVRFHASQTEAA